MNNKKFNATELSAALDEARAIQRDAKNAGTRYVSAEGLALLAEEGVSAFQEATEHFLPHNLVRSEMSGPYSRRLPIEEANAEIERYARFGGWLNAATSNLPAVRKMVERTQSSRGINSDYTYCNLWEVVARFPSPGNLERLLWKVRRRAEAILSAYDDGDFTPAWRDVINALLKTKSVGKAAVIVVAATLGMDIRGERDYDKDRLVRPSYQEARDWLAKRRTARFPEPASEGIRHAAEPELEESGVRVYPGLQIGRFGVRELVWVARRGELVFVADSGMSPQKALEAALDEWSVSSEAEDMEVVSVRLVDNHPWNGMRYHFNYEVVLGLEGRRGRFSVSEHYAHNQKSYDVSVVGDDYIDTKDPAEIFRIVEKHKEKVSARHIMELLGMTEEIMVALGFRKDAEEPEVEITSQAFGAGIIDYWYEGPKGGLFFRDRGRSGNGPTNSSWYSYNGGPRVFVHLTEEERISMVS